VFHLATIHPVNASAMDPSMDDDPQAAPREAIDSPPPPPPPPPPPAATLTFKVFAIDTSGSMSDAAQVQTSPGKYEPTGLDLMQLVSQAAAAAAAAMAPAQVAGAVSFSQRAAVVARPAPMDEAGRAALKASLLELRPGGATNLWAAIELGATLLQPLFRAHGNAGASFAIDLLTDGCPNVEPPNLAGYAASLRDLKRSLGFLPIVNTFGFGYNCDVPLLEEISRQTNGHFAFISSPDMVATSFVNASAHWGAQEPPCAIDGVSDRWRLELVASLRAMYRSAQLGDFIAAQTEVRRLSAGMRADAPAAAAATAALAAAAAAGGGGGVAGAEPPFVPLVEYLRDVEKEVALAVSDARFWRVWGHAYIVSLARAHELRICATFKDAGLQCYAGPRFRAIQAHAASNFRAAMDAAAAAAAVSAAAASQRWNGASAAIGRAAAIASLYDPAGGCFHGDCIVTLADGSEKRARDIVCGDRVRAIGGAEGEVFEVMRTRVPPTAEAVCFKGGLKITAWHPVRLNAPGAAWAFPSAAAFADVEAAGTAATCGLDLVFSFGVCGVNGEAPSAVHGVVVNGALVATLGHEVQGDPVLTHGFYGTRAVLDAVAAMRAEGGDVVNERGWRFSYDKSGVPLGIMKVESAR